MIRRGVTSAVPERTYKASAHRCQVRLPPLQGIGPPLSATTLPKRGLLKFRDQTHGVCQWADGPWECVARCLRGSKENVRGISLSFITQWPHVVSSRFSCQGNEVGKLSFRLHDFADGSCNWGVSEYL